jgi:hypothetical protein
MHKPSVLPSLWYCGTLSARTPIAPICVYRCPSVVKKSSCPTPASCNRKFGNRPLHVADKPCIPTRCYRACSGVAAKFRSPLQPNHRPSSFSWFPSVSIQILHPCLSSAVKNSSCPTVVSWKFLQEVAGICRIHFRPGITVQHQHLRSALLPLLRLPTRVTFLGRQKRAESLGFTELVTLLPFRRGCALKPLRPQRSATIRNKTQESAAIRKQSAAAAGQLGQQTVNFSRATQTAVNRRFPSRRSAVNGGSPGFSNRRSPAVIGGYRHLTAVNGGYRRLY